jgi:sugar phosphate isomerase/epimerase
LFIGAVHSPFSNDPKTIQSALELAKQLDASVFVIHTPKTKETKYRKWFEKNVSRLQEKEHKIKISVENMPKKARENRHLCNDLKDLTNFKFLTLDTCHLASYVPNIESIFSLGLNNIVHIHLSNKTKKNDHLPLTRRGGLDLAGFLLSVRNSGYTGFITLEVMADDLEAGFPEATANELKKSVGLISRNLA